MRAIPGSQRFVATAAAHHGQAFGSLVVLDPRVPDDDQMSAVKRLTPEVGFPESQGGTESYGEAVAAERRLLPVLVRSGARGRPESRRHGRAGRSGHRISQAAHSRATRIPRDFTGCIWSTASATRS